MQMPGRNNIDSGSNKGLGYEVCRQLLQDKHPVIAAARTLQKGGSMINTMFMAMSPISLDIKYDQVSCEQYIDTAAEIDVVMTPACWAMIAHPPLTFRLYRNFTATYAADDTFARLRKVTGHHITVQPLELDPSDPASIEAGVAKLQQSRNQKASKSLLM